MKKAKKVLLVILRELKASEVAVHCAIVEPVG
jgi:hypothetical protein